jgi:hypothetical protein
MYLSLILLSGCGANMQVYTCNPMGNKVKSEEYVCAQHFVTTSCFKSGGKIEEKEKVKEKTGAKPTPTPKPKKEGQL